MTNSDQAAAFLQCLGGGTFVFQTFDDSENKRRDLSRVLIGTYEQHKETLQALNNQGAGVFVQVNEGEGRGKDHITYVRALFVDLDNPKTASESIKAIQQYMPKPSMVVNSSKGKFHIYWKVVDCLVDDFKKSQQQLAITFNADVKMGNLDRVMRVPGFKHHKGEPFDTTVTVFDTMHMLDDIYNSASQAPIMTVMAPPNVESDPLKKDVFGLDISSDYEVPESIKEGGRNYALIQHVGHLIGTGERDEESAKNKIRKLNNTFEPPLSEAELEATIFQSLAKYLEDARIEDEQQATTALENQVPPVPPAVKIEGAEMEVPEPPKPPFEQLLERYVFCTEGSKVIDTLSTGEYNVMALTDFRNMLKNTGRKGALASQWLESDQRKTCRDVMWFPSQDEIVKSDVYGFYNLYRKPLLTPVEKEDFDMSKLDIFFEHMCYLFPDEDDREFFLNWFAKTIVAPTVRIPWAPLIISEQGAGKGFIFEVLAHLVGIHNADNVLMQSLESQFNPFMMSCSVLLVDEVSKPRNKALNDKIKAYISEPRLKINRKGMQERTFPVYCNVLMFSNNDDAAMIDDGDRRYWVHKVRGVKTSKYYDKLFSWFKRETTTEKVIFYDNLKHLLRWCLDRDLSKFNHNHKPPSTKSKIEMVFESKSNLEVDLMDAIEGREGPFGADIVAVPIVKQFMATKRDEDLKGADEKLIAKVLNRISSATMIGNAITTLSKDIPGRYRVRCIRNVDYWSNQPNNAIRHELTRSMQMHLNMKDILPPALNEVGEV